jgi:hypothetical protein
MSRYDNNFNKKSVKELMKDQSKGKTLTPYEKEEVKAEAIKNRQRNKTKPK